MTERRAKFPRPRQSECPDFENHEVWGSRFLGTPSPGPAPVGFRGEERSGRTALVGVLSVMGIFRQLTEQSTVALSAQLTLEGVIRLLQNSAGRSDRSADSNDLKDRARRFTFLLVDAPLGRGPVEVPFVVEN